MRLIWYKWKLFRAPTIANSTLFEAMKSVTRSLMSIGISLLAMMSAKAREQRLVGYANGKPMYVSGGPIVRPALPAHQVRVAQPVRYYQPAPRVNVGSTRSNHGPVFYGGGGGYYPGADYGYGYGYGYGNGYAGGQYGNMGNRCNVNGSNGNGRNCNPLAQPYQAAAFRGYSWIPRYGQTTAIPKYTK